MFAHVAVACDSALDGAAARGARRSRHAAFLRPQPLPRSTDLSRPPTKVLPLLLLPAPDSTTFTHFQPRAHGLSLYAAGCSSVATFLQLTALAAMSALSPRILGAEEQREPGEPATSFSRSAFVATFEEVWQTVRDRFYDPHLHGLDCSAVRERYLPDAVQATSEEELAGIINAMLSQLHASHTGFYTPDQPDPTSSPIFSLGRYGSGLERAFQGATSLSAACVLSCRRWNPIQKPSAVTL